jgi:hypothetical protein
MSDEQKKVAFDVVKAGFYLIAFILGFHMFIVLMVGSACIYGRLVEHFSPADACKDVSGLLSDILTGGLASALAFVGGRNMPSGKD